jgi:hypothetical protein
MVTHLYVDKVSKYQILLVIVSVIGFVCVGALIIFSINIRDENILKGLVSILLLTFVFIVYELSIKLRAEIINQKIVEENKNDSERHSKRK